MVGAFVLEEHAVYNTTKKIGYILTSDRLTVDVCKVAILKAAKGKKRRPSVKRTLHNLDARAEKLRNLIIDGTYVPSPYTVCNVIDHPSGKARVLHKPKFFPDQCVHHVIILLIGEEILKRLDPYAIASVPNRGTHYGWRAIRKWLNRSKSNTRYCLKCDIRKCYESIKPEVVVSSLATFIKDKFFLRLVSKVAHSHTCLPLGNYTSGWFQNLLLRFMDIAVRKSGLVKHYLRYVDDFIALSGNKRALMKVRIIIVEELQKLGLKLKDNWQIFPVADRGIDIIGYRFFHSYILLRKRNLLGLIRCIRSYNKKVTAKKARSLLSRIGFCKWFNSYHFWQKYCSNLDFKKIKKEAYA